MELDIDSVLKERKFFQRIKCGDDGKKDTPVPISNTEVKLSCADNTWREAAWECRSLPVCKKDDLSKSSFYFIFERGQMSMKMRSTEYEFLSCHLPMAVSDGGAESEGFS